MLLPACGGDSDQEDSASNDSTNSEESGNETVAETGTEGETGMATDFPNCSCAEDYAGDGTCYEVDSGDSEGLLVAANSVEDGDMLVVGMGVYEMDNQVTIRANDVTVCFGRALAYGRHCAAIAARSHRKISRGQKPAQFPGSFIFATARPWGMAAEN